MDTALILPAVSYHTEPGYEWFNPGLGASIGDHDHVGMMTVGPEVMAVVYRDSFKQPAGLFGMGARIRYGYTWRVEGSATISYIHGSGRDGPTLVPSVGVGYSRYSIHAIWSPGVVAAVMKVEL